METISKTNASYFRQFQSEIENVSSFLRKNGFNDFAIVGSAALLACGYPLNRIPHDVDIEVVCEEKQETVFKALSDAYGNNFYEKKEDYPIVGGFVHKPYIFEIEGVKVNVWCVSKFTHDMFVEVGGIRYSTLMSTLEHKMCYGRKKDVFDLIDFQKILLKFL